MDLCLAAPMFTELSAPFLPYERDARPVYEKEKRMPIYRRGFEFEDRICTQLERSGFTLQRNPVLDHKHKLDFVILSFPDNLAYSALGVQVTGRSDDYEKQEEFLAANQTTVGIPKLLYLELGNRIDLEAGGANLVIAVIMNYQFNSAYADIRIAGATITDDMRYQFFHIPERAKQLREKADKVEWERAKAVPLPADLGLDRSNHSNGTAPIVRTGSIRSYFRQGGNGFIHDRAGNTFFFHISHVADPELRDALNELPYVSGAANLNRPVRFDDVGRTRPGARYPEGRNVRMEIETD